MATLKAVEFHGGYRKGGGWDNLDRHIDIVRSFGIEPVVAINRFPDDSSRALTRLKRACEKKDVRCEISEVHARGSEGGEALARAVVEASSSSSRRRKFHFLYPDRLGLRQKIETLATKIYRARSVRFAGTTARRLEQFEDMGYGELPICMAKTDRKSVV